ncbi:SIS domain-containing protein [Paenibacillus sp. J22TS3]|uniref:SIS domain-containing protein n=1 Tax=Paenibacillus sp. J22TS3 TaxID=2807192 RepID=UPI001AFDB0B4|nr:SIS domain-containing protein [Paenibacillus sp. J22TS3]GIP21621.1 glucosamine--fructose-6-phosphate aminotransferase [Paenibacillus sp. J22TS3]
MSLTYREVKDQYKALQMTYDYMLAKRDEFTAFVRAQKVTSVTFIGCGSSYCLSEAAAFSFRLRAGLPAISLAAGDLMLHADRYRSMLSGTLAIAPSRSGSTSEVVESLRLLRSGGQHIPVLTISCVADSPLSASADFSLELPWAFDHSVCQTRTVTNLYAANLLLAAFLAGDEDLIADMQEAINQGEAYMARVEDSIRRTSDYNWTNAVLLGDGELHGLAAEGALAITEIARTQAHAYHFLDVRHGPMVTVGSNTLVIAAFSDSGIQHQHNLVRDIKERGATVIGFADRAGVLPHEFLDLAFTTEQPLDTAVRGIPFIFIPQIAALASAERQGINPDQPDGLVAWVKL